MGTMPHMHSKVLGSVALVNVGLDSKGLGLRLRVWFLRIPVEQLFVGVDENFGMIVRLAKLDRTFTFCRGQ